MTYLAHVISKLHDPPSVSRQAFALSRADAERLPLIQNVAVISITTPDRAPAALLDFEHLLRLAFEDLDHRSAHLSDRAKAKLERAFRPEHAQQILQFVAELPNEIRTIVVHCEGGYSRSCAVALALHRLFGYIVEQQRLKQANPSVIAVMLDAAQPKPGKLKG